MNKVEMSVGNKLERKTIEKNRRNRMKDLCFELASLIPPQHSKKHKKFMSQPDQIGQAVAYIRSLRERMDELRRRKREVAEMNIKYYGIKNADKIDNIGESKLPVLKIRDLGSDLEVVLISGTNKTFMVHQILRIVEEEGAEVVTVSIFANVDKIFLTLYAQVKIARVGVDTSRICERIHELISIPYKAY